MGRLKVIKTLVCPTCGATFQRHPSNMKHTRSAPVCSLKCRVSVTAAAKKRREALPLPPPVMGARWIPLTKGKFALVDEDLYDELSQYNWHYGNGYAVCAARGEKRRGGAAIKLHRVVVGARRGDIVDHINFDTLDCRRVNLRKTRSWQASNAHRRKHVGDGSRNIRSKYKGVCRPADYAKWIALITIDDKTIRLGTFATEEEAARAYDDAAAKHFGEYAHLNFPRQRCPSCSPLHSSEAGIAGFFRQRSIQKSVCAVCGGTRRVSVEVAARYLAALRDFGG